jgi:hypothetical protein
MILSIYVHSDNTQAEIVAEFDLTTSLIVYLPLTVERSGKRCLDLHRE